MNAETTTSNNHQATRTPDQGASAAATAHARIHLGGYVVISFVATMLALATANECQSITHLPSLVYGIVLWGWWGVIASALWELGARKPAVSSFSVKAIAIQIPVSLVLSLMHLVVLWSLGFTALGWGEHRNPTVGVAQPYQCEPLRHRDSDLRFHFWDHRHHSISNSRPAGSYEVARIAAAALRRTTPSAPDAAGTALPLQHAKRDYYVG